MKILAAAIQMTSAPLDVEANLAKADQFVREWHQAGATLAVLPEMFNTGYGLLPDYGPLGRGSRGADPGPPPCGPASGGWRSPPGSSSATAATSTTRWRSSRPTAGQHVYRKRNLVFWEPSRFRPGRSPLVVATRWGRIGFAVCADMIYRKVCTGYLGADRPGDRRGGLARLRGPRDRAETLAAGSRRSALGGDPGQGGAATWGSRWSSPISAARPRRSSRSWGPGSPTGSPA